MGLCTLGMCVCVWVWELIFQGYGLSDCLELKILVESCLVCVPQKGFVEGWIHLAKAVPSFCSSAHHTVAASRKERGRPRDLPAGGR